MLGYECRDGDSHCMLREAFLALIFWMTCQCCYQHASIRDALPISRQGCLCCDAWLRLSLRMLYEEERTSFPTRCPMHSSVCLCPHAKRINNTQFRHCGMVAHCDRKVDIGDGFVAVVTHITTHACKWSYQQARQRILILTGVSTANDKDVF